MTNNTPIVCFTYKISMWTWNICDYKICNSFIMMQFTKDQHRSILKGDLPSVERDKISQRGKPLFRMYMLRNRFKLSNLCSFTYMPL